MEFSIQNENNIQFNNSPNVNISGYNNISKSPGIKNYIIHNNIIKKIYNLNFR